MYTTERDLQGSIELICLCSKNMCVHLTFSEGVPSVLLLSASTLDVQHWRTALQPQMARPAKSYSHSCENRFPAENAKVEKMMNQTVEIIQNQRLIQRKTNVGADLNVKYPPSL